MGQNERCFMTFFRILLLVATLGLCANCASVSQNENGVIETSEYVLDLGDDTAETKELVKQASSSDEESD